MRAAPLIDQTRISHIWHALGGGDIRRGRGRAWWRRGDGWSVALDDEHGRWYDHRDGIGGGVLDLICHVRGGSRGDALRWLADWRGVPLDGDRSCRQTRGGGAFKRGGARGLFSGSTAVAMCYAQ